jgi:hypothetical protein
MAVCNVAQERAVHNVAQESAVRNVAQESATHAIGYAVCASAVAVAQEADKSCSYVKSQEMYSCLFHDNRSESTCRVEYLMLAADGKDQKLSKIYLFRTDIWTILESPLPL